MTEDTKGTALLAEMVGNILELQSRHRIDQETMLLYMCSMNLTSILSFLDNRWPGNSDCHVQPVVSMGQIEVPDSKGDNIKKDTSPSDSASQPAKLLNNGSGSDGQGFNQAALMNLLGLAGLGQDSQGANPAALINLLNVLGGQNGELNNLMKSLSSLMGTNFKNRKQAVPKNNQADKPTPVPAPVSAEAKQPLRQVPKVMKWDNLENRPKENRPKAQS